MGDRSGGFSLLELMIVVAVAAILVMIAMPNYQRMVERVKLNQGKMALASLHSAEKIFYAEYESYTTRLDAVGFLLEGKTYFEIGFDMDFPPPPNAPQGTAACNKLCNATCALSAGGICTAAATNSLDGTFLGFATANTYRAVGHSHFGQVVIGPNQNAHTLTIDQNRQITEIFPAN